MTNTPYSRSSEKELFEILAHAALGSEVDNKTRRIEGLEELLERIKANSIKNTSEAMQILLDMARIQGNRKPEFFLITESMQILINKHEEIYPQLLNGLEDYEDKIFLCFSKLILSLDHKNKEQGIKYLVGFLTTRDNLQGVGAKEVYECLLSLGTEHLSSEIVKEATSFLKSSPDKQCALVFSVKLCSKFATNKLLPNMLDVLDRSMKGYFNGYYFDVEREICEFLGRVKDAQTISHLMRLLKMRFKEDNSHVKRAIASILDTHIYRVDDVLEILYDQTDREFINAILKTLEEMDKPVDAKKLLGKIRPSWWKEFKFSQDILLKLLVKGGQNSKTVLFDLLQQDDRYDFALECLKDVGVLRDEIAAIFPKPPLLQLYNFFYKQKNGLQSLDQIWNKKEKLGDDMRGSTNRLEHLLVHIFSSFNFATMNIAPLSYKGVDLVCFYPETLDLFIIGCTTGTMKNDLQTMDSTIKNMEAELPDIFRKCSVTGIVVSSEMATIPQADFHYAAQNGIVILQRENIDELLEMLDTNRQSNRVLKYIKSLFHTNGISVS